MQTRWRLAGTLLLRTIGGATIAALSRSELMAMRQADLSSTPLAPTLTTRPPATPRPTATPAPTVTPIA